MNPDFLLSLEINLNVRARTKSLLEEKTRSSKPWGRQRFLRHDTKNTDHKRKKFDKLDFTKIKSFSLQKTLVRK